MCGDDTNIFALVSTGYTQADRSGQHIMYTRAQTWLEHYCHSGHFILQFQNNTGVILPMRTEYSHVHVLPVGVKQGSVSGVKEFEGLLDLCTGVFYWEVF